MPASSQRTIALRRLKKLDTKIRAGIASGQITDYAACTYPTCEEPRVSEECCYRHSLNIVGPAARAFVSNDGIIDWQAIAVARSGERVVALTWVEFEIAGAHILADGGTREEMFERTGIHCRHSGDQITRIKELADAFTRI